ncbi:MAG TPA: heterocyst frequency control protein PatD [Thermosynechococcaceae cyanobacterium]
MPEKLPIDHYSHYETFREALGQLRNAIAEPAPDLSSLKSQANQVQTMFHQQILPLRLDELEPSIAHHVQSYQVEINKQLRLLSTDLNFLQAARQPATLKQRQQQVDDRLATLLRYCGAVMN